MSDTTQSEFGKDSEVQSTTNIEKHDGVLRGSMTSGNSFANANGSAMKNGASLLEKGGIFPHSHDILLTDENGQDGQDSGFQKGDNFPASLKSSPDEKWGNSSENQELGSEEPLEENKEFLESEQAE